MSRYIDTLEFFVPTNRHGKNGAKRGMDGMNDIVRQSRGKAVYANIRKCENEQHVARYAREAIEEQGWECKDTLHTVVLTFIEPDERRDDDNVFAGSKYVLDALCEPQGTEKRRIHSNGAGAIPDDDPLHVCLLCQRGKPDRNNPGIMVKIIRSAS